MNWLLLVSTLVLSVVAGCSRQQPATSYTNTPTAPVESKSEPGKQASTVDEEQKISSIPSDIRYSVIDSDVVPGVKRTLDIRLNKKVSEEILGEIALKLKAGDSHQYERTLICYYLPGMTVGSGAWATTHFDPDLQVQILGLTEQAEKTQKSKPQPSNRKVIGKWVDSGIAGGTITIFRKDGGYFMETQYSDGSCGTRRLVKASARRYNNPESDAGDHFVINSDGDLEISDNDGLMATATRAD